MARFVIFAVGLVLAVAFNFVACSGDPIQSNIEVVQSIEEYLEENPGLEVQPLVEEVNEKGPSQYYENTYKFGNRIDGEEFEFNSSANQRPKQIVLFKELFTK